MTAIHRELLLALVVLIAVLGWGAYWRLRMKLRRLIRRIRQSEADSARSVTLPPKKDDAYPVSELVVDLSARVQKATANVRASDERRRELVANVSHDLRTPLTCLRGYLETMIMKNDSLDLTQRAGYLNIMLEQVEFLVRLVNELFELSRLDAHVAVPKLERVQLPEICSDLVQKFTPSAEKRQVKLLLEVPHGGSTVLADIYMIERAISNILQNAVAYSQEGGSVTVRIAGADSKVRTEVIDSGIGIPEEDLPHVFERFYRVNKDRSRRTGGTGLGLAIAKGIVEAHGSVLQIASTVGKGTRVFFDLPSV